MYKRILVPLDGSPLAEAILPQVERLTRGTDPELILLQAYDTPSEGMGPDDAVTQLDLAAREYLESRRAAFGSAAGTRGTVRALARRGEAATVILETARDTGSDLVAMTTHGYSGLSHWVHGSVAERVIRNAPVPLLILKSFESVESGAPRASPGPIRRILVPFDGSRESEQAIPHALELAHRFDAEITMLYVLEEAGTREPEYSALFGGHRLAQVVETLRGRGERVTAATEQGYPADRILHVARRWGADLIAMTTHGRRGLSRLWFGSVAEKIVRSMARPLLLVRIRESSGEEHPETRPA